MSKWIAQETAGTTSIATTSTTDEYMIVKKTGKVTFAGLLSLSGLAAHDSNYITPTITNLGADGSGSTAILAASDANTTKATGGALLTANVVREWDLHATAANLNVTEGDVLRLRATATGTLAGAVTRPMWKLVVKTVQR
jgi:hypothetical protein